MSLRPSWMIALAAGLILAPGCTGIFTKRAIERFAVSLQEQDLEKLKSSSSEHFVQKALRQDDAAKGLKMLKLPLGQVEVVSVEEISENKRKARVKVGEKEKAKEIEYLLSRDSKGRGWVVDDIIMLQDSGNGRIVERSVTEQMDLLLTCRELLISWREESLEEKLAYCDQELQSLLKPLPNAWLDQMFKEIAGPGKQSKFKPDARLKDQTAFVVVPHPQGNLYLELLRVEDSWKLHDLAIEPTSRDSTGIRSLQKMVAALNQSARFLESYAANDLEGLSSASSKHLYENCLIGADLKQVPLPVTKLLEGAYEARQYTDGSDDIKRVELLMQSGKQTYMLTLREENQDEQEKGRKSTEFRVDDLTIFEEGSTDVKRISSVFLSQAIVEAYVAALSERDITKLREISSMDFNERVWSRPEAVHFAIMPEPDLREGDLEVISTVFRGDVSEVTVIKGETPMTLVLHLTKGWMVVDDVLMPALERPTSLKQNLEVLFSVHAFASALHRKDMQELIRQSAEGLDRIAWKQLSVVPPFTEQLVRPLMSEVVAIRPGEDWTTVETSDGNIHAEIRVVREGSGLVVHDVVLKTESAPGQEFALLHTLRDAIASGRLGPANKRTGLIEPVAGTQPPVRSAVQQAVFEPISPEVYSKPSTR